MSEKHKVILLTGAGFSRLAGMPTLHTIKSKLEIPIDPPPALDLVTQIWRIVRADRGDSATLEDLLARLKYYVEITDFIQRDTILSTKLRAVFPGNSDHLKEEFNNALGACFRLILDTYGPQEVETESEGYRIIVEVLKRLAHMNGNPLHIFTTNYDCLFNVMAAREPQSLKFLSHINNKNGYFENNWFVTNDLAEETSCEIRIHRLHGCIAWYDDPASPYGVAEIYGAGECLTIDDQNKLNQMDIKLVSDENIGDRPAFSLAFRELENELKQCETLLVWGHSFRDLGLLSCIIRASKNSCDAPFKCYYIDPYLTEFAAIENIKRTVRRTVPEIDPETLAPKNIQWDVPNGLEKLIEKLNRKGIHI